MFGGGGMNNKKMERMMKQMGITMSEIEDAQEVTIKTATKEINIKNPEITIMEARGEKTYQIVGEEQEEPLINEEDIELVMDRTNASRDEATNALEKTDGDIAKAITELE